MNLARVEHYFAPFLSAMEGKDGRLAIHSSRDPVEAIQPSMAWPTNLFILGTVNMDETTYPFSDKVLDRAFTFEFWNVDLDGWRASVIARGAHVLLDQVFPVLQAMSAALKPARRHFGYRTCDEVLGFVNASSESDPAAALDAAILAKVLPKVRGDSGGALPLDCLRDVSASDRAARIINERRFGKLRLQILLKDIPVTEAKPRLLELSSLTAAHFDLSIGEDSKGSKMLQIQLKQPHLYSIRSTLLAPILDSHKHYLQ